MTNNNDQKKLFILGAYKTATCTLMGMLNCHPEILILCETQLNKGEIWKYARDFLDKYPDARYLFRFSENFDRLYSELGNYFRNKGYAYKYVGDKLPYLDINILRECEGNKIIYNIRDIRSWLVKDSIVWLFLTGNDLVPAAIDYSVCFLESFLLPDVFHCRMEDLINENSVIIAKLADFLSIDLNPHLDNWWNKIEIKDDDNPKSAQKWWLKHPSSNQKPAKIDTTVELKPHKFWDILLPIFDKYYLSNGNDNFTHEEITTDINTLKSLTMFSPLLPNSAYKRIKQYLGVANDNKVRTYTL